MVTLEKNVCLLTVFNFKFMQINYKFKVLLSATKIALYQTKVHPNLYTILPSDVEGDPHIYTTRWTPRLRSDTKKKN